MYGIVRLILCLFIYIGFRNLIARSKIKRKKGLQISAVIGIVVIYSGMFFVPFENLFVTFDSPIAVYNYSHLGGTNIKVEIEGEYSSCIVDFESESKTTFAIIPKEENGWKITTGFDDKIVFSAFTGGVSANVYQFKDTNDYYISILDLTKEESTIVDEYDTEFQSLVFRNDKGVITDAWHYAYIPYFDSQYTITVNGNKVEFQEYKGLFK